MNGVAHYLFGLLITLGVIKLFDIINENQERNEIASTEHENNFTPAVIATIIIIAFFSHMLVDALAHFTYHPSNSNWGDPVYAGWHLTTYIAEAVFAIYFLRTDIRYTFGMLASVGFDLWDWSTVRPLDKYFGIELPGVHFMADATQNFLFGSFQSLRNEQWALMVEVITVIFLFFVWRTWHQQSKIEEHARPASIKELVVLILIFGTLRLFTLI